MKTEERLAALEALLFALGEMQELDELARLLEISPDECRQGLEDLELKYLRDEATALCLKRVGKRYGLSLRPELHPLLEQVYRPNRAAALTPAAYEVLAAIAYNQPVTRAQIEEVRGVNSDSIISRLQDRGLVEQVGQLDLPGRPALFAVSEQFMLEAGLKDLEDLPTMDLLLYDSIQSLGEEQE